MKMTKYLSVGAALTLLPTFALAQDAAPGFDEIGPYIMTTLLFLVGGFLVFWMAAGFAMLEAGLVRSKNVAMQLTKNVALFSIASRSASGSLPAACCPTASNTLTRLTSRPSSRPGLIVPP